jgi:hypothetical protein
LIHNVENTMKLISKDVLRQLRGGGNDLSDRIQAAKAGDPTAGFWGPGNSPNVQFIRENLGGPGNGIGNFVSASAKGD